MKRTTTYIFQPHCGKRRQLCDSVTLVCCVLGELSGVLLWAALEEKLEWCYTECARWETLNNVGRECAKKSNLSQPVGHQEVRLPTSLGSGKVQLHNIRQIREMGLGGKNQRVGSDERTGERVKLVGRRSAEK